MKTDTTDKFEYFVLGLQIGGGESVFNSKSDKSNLYLKDNQTNKSTKVTNNNED